MMESKNKSSYHVQKVVRASKSTNKTYSSIKLSKAKIASINRSLPSPEDYYPKHLKKFGRNQTHGYSLCPFHKEKNPSFSVDLKTGKFCCHACNAHGTSIAWFHAKKYGLSWTEACKDLGVRL